MNLYMIEQGENNDYDTFDSAIVCAENLAQAIRIHPDGYPWSDKHQMWVTIDGNGKVDEAPMNTWARNIGSVIAYQVGVATNKNIELGQVVLASFNAG